MAVTKCGASAEGPIPMRNNDVEEALRVARFALELAEAFRRPTVTVGQASDAIHVLTFGIAQAAEQGVVRVVEVAKSSTNWRRDHAPDLTVCDAVISRAEDSISRLCPLIFQQWNKPIFPAGSPAAEVFVIFKQFPKWKADPAQCAKMLASVREFGLSSDDIGVREAYAALEKVFARQYEIGLTKMAIPENLRKEISYLLLKMAEDIVRRGIAAYDNRSE